MSWTGEFVSVTQFTKRSFWTITTTLFFSTTPLSLRDSANPDIRYHLAVALAKSGREAEARNELKKILKPGAIFDESDEALVLQKRLGP